MVYFFIISFSLDWGYIPVKVNLGYSNQYMTIAHFSASTLGLHSELITLGVSLYGQENFFYEHRNGRIKTDFPTWEDSIDLIIRYRNLFSQYIFNAELHPLKRIPFFIRIEGSLWARARIDHWIVSEIISENPIKFYDYALYELYPKGYKRLSIGIEPLTLFNSEIFVEAGIMNISYPKIDVKEINTAFNQLYLSVGTNFLHKRTNNRLPWEIALATGIDATATGTFTLTYVWNERYMKDWQLSILGGLSVVSGAGCGYFQHYVKRLWLKPEDKFWSKALKKGGVGLASGLIYELAMISGYIYASRDWPHNGDYMVRDFAYLSIIKIVFLGHLLTSLVF